MKSATSGILAALALAACGQQDRNSGVTAEEARALDETEAMLDEAEIGDLPVTGEAATNAN